MPIISVSRLKKIFRTKHKSVGLHGSINAIFHPRWKEIIAVNDLSFDMEPGELLGFIGPNGAGKSTTIKMLTGILYPSSGEARVLGMVPWQQRQKLAYQVGTVFGQRPQLWYHLPAIDTFYLFGKIYELDDDELRTRISFLTEAFEIGDLLETPVRKLSLGQRMRCEVAASLLHHPKIILLDEPSIGLDVVAKQRIRDTVKRMNELEGVGVLLTSHDAGDIEALCRRVIVINHGQIVFQDKVSSLKRRYLTSKMVDVRYAEQISENFTIEGTETIKIAKERYGVKLQFDTRQTDVGPVIAQLAEAGNLVDVTISDPSLEEVIRTIYQETEQSKGL